MIRILCFLVLFFTCTRLFGQTGEQVYKIIPAPENPEQWKAWTDSLFIARERLRKTLNYDDSFYEDPAFQWAAECYNIYFLMLFDNAFYNPQTGIFGVENFIEARRKEFGKIDGVVLWHAYPRIGIDPKNQFDHYREFPGGLEGLRKVVEKFHAYGIRVFIDYNPWDRSTRREGRDDVEVLAEIVRIIGADGIFLDTLTEGGSGFRGILNSAREGVVLESELALPVGRIFDHHMSWAQWFGDSHVPGILWNKWFERRHMMHQIRRWDLDHTAELQTAWMNGTGMLIWENVFGTWMPWNERDKSWLRLIGPVQREFGFLFRGEGWSPLYPVMLNDVYANYWHSGSYQLWTVVNRSTDPKKGMLMKIPVRPGMRVFDLFRGEEIAFSEEDSTGILVDLPPRGYGAILAVADNQEGNGLQEFLNLQKKRFAEMDMGVDVHETREILVEPNGAAIQTKVPRQMVIIENIPEKIEISYRQRECGFYGHDGYIPPPDRIHQQILFTRPVDTKKYAIDLTPVTNREYYRFIVRSGYKPADTANFLKHWPKGKPPRDILEHPVVYVSLDDARAYAEWVGKRLPTEEEWQIAAQGGEKNIYPWGNSFSTEKCNAGQFGGTTSVKKFPEGRSSYGCYDMSGNTWEWTESERTDGHTRYVILKGGSWFRAEGSDWYFEGGPQTTGHAAKYILFWPGMDRSPVIGFRCAVSMKQ